MKLTEMNHKIWHFFNEILAIPRASKHEEQIRQYIVDFAEKRHLSYQIDAIGNVVVRKPAAKGKEHLPIVILQSHMDMVCEKNADVQHDFSRDGIQHYIDGDWLKAQGTTLGADNGIGVAIELYLLDSEKSFGELECLFTVDEETGLTGASNIAKNLLKGKRMINLDSEDIDEIFIGSAGGVDTIASIEIEKEQPSKPYFFFQASVLGLLGGHSGDDINKGRANANLLLFNYLKELREACGDVRIITIDGGNLRNAIPREATILCAVPFAAKETARVILNCFIAEMEESECKLEKGFEMTLGSESSLDYITSKTFSDNLINAICNCPNGVISMSKDFENLVQTSTNLASIKIKGDKVVISTSQRSSLDVEKEEISTKVARNFIDKGFGVKHENNYSGWYPNIHSKLLEDAIEAFKETQGKNPRVRSIHAGLECGLFIEKYPDLDIISVGPTILNVHSPQEQLSISSVENFLRFLERILNKEC